MLGENYGRNNFILSNYSFIAYVFSKYLYRVALIQPTFADGIFRNFENVCFKIIGTDLEHMSAKRYLKHF